MKIEKITSYLVRDMYIVEITTDSGLSGIGQTACWGYPESVKTTVDKFENILIGLNPLDTEHISQLMEKKN